MKTNYDVFMESVKDIDSLSDLLDRLTSGYECPWTSWFDNNYCKKCETLDGSYPETPNIRLKFAWCELNHKCKFFPELKRTPTERDVIKYWLVRETEDRDD